MSDGWLRCRAPRLVWACCLSASWRRPRENDRRFLRHRDLLAPGVPGGELPWVGRACRRRSDLAQSATCKTSIVCCPERDATACYSSVEIAPKCCSKRGRKPRKIADAGPCRAKSQHRLPFAEIGFPASLSLEDTTARRFDRVNSPLLLRSMQLARASIISTGVEVITVS